MTDKPKFLKDYLTLSVSDLLKLPPDDSDNIIANIIFDKLFSWEGPHVDFTKYPATGLEEKLLAKTAFLPLDTVGLNVRDTQDHLKIIHGFALSQAGPLLAQLEAGGIPLHVFSLCDTAFERDNQPNNVRAENVIITLDEHSRTLSLIKADPTVAGLQTIPLGQRIETLFAAHPVFPGDGSQIYSGFSAAMSPKQAGFKRLVKDVLGVRMSFPEQQSMHDFIFNSGQIFPSNSHVLERQDAIGRTARAIEEMLK